MKFRLSLPAALATGLVHALLIAVVIGDALDADQATPTPSPESLSVTLIEPPVAARPAPPSPAPAEVPSPPLLAPASPKRPLRPPPPSSSTPPREVVRRAPKPASEQVTAAPPASTPSDPAPATVDTPTPAPSTSIAPPAAVAASPSVPAPARTSISIASYAATNRKPPYPRLSRTSGEEGTVILRVLVKTDGTVGAIELTSSSGFPLLDESARSTVRNWRFHPATIDGKPVAEWYQVPIPFTLHEP